MNIFFWYWIYFVYMIIEWMCEHIYAGVCVSLRMSVCKTCYGINDELSDSCVCVNDHIHLIHRNQQIYPKETSKQDSVSLLWYMCLKMLCQCVGGALCVYWWFWCTWILFEIHTQKLLHMKSHAHTWSSQIYSKRMSFDHHEEICLLLGWSFPMETQSIWNLKKLPRQDRFYRMTVGNFVKICLILLNISFLLNISAI